MFDYCIGLSDTYRHPTAKLAAAATLSCCFLVGCSSSPSPLLAPPQTIQTGQLPARLPGAGGAADQVRLQILKNCPTLVDAAKPIGVTAMLEQAKATPDAPKTATMSKADADCLAARVKAQLIATSGPSATTAGAGGQAAAAQAAVGQAKTPDLTIDFDSETAPISPKDQRAIAEMLARKGGATGKVRIFAGRGGSGNMFDQAVVAQKRANRVKELLPIGMVVSVEFDPLQIDDTVRIEFIDKT
jgi:hypothetical protein